MYNVTNENDSTYGSIQVTFASNSTHIFADTLGDAINKAREIYGNYPVDYEGLPTENRRKDLPVGKASFENTEDCKIH